MTEDQLAARFEEQRTHLRTVAHRMLGSLAEADDAVQETWLRLSRAGDAGIVDLRAWLTTVLARICLNGLRSRAARREQPLGPLVPDPVVDPPHGSDPEHEALLAEAVGQALHVVLATLNPPERLAFVLHDLFGVPYGQIAPMLDRSPAAVRQLASRARRRVRGAQPAPATDPRRQRAVVDAFFDAGRAGDFDALVDLLHPDVVLRADGPGGSVLLRGRPAVGGQARRFATPDRQVHPALVDGAAGVVVTDGGRPQSVLGFTVRDGLIVAIDAVSDPVRLARLDLAAVTGPAHPATDRRGSSRSVGPTGDSEGTSS